MEFISVGEKIKKLRKQLKMRQEALSDTNITRAYISMIEIGKRCPSKDIAKIILNKFKARAEELGTKLDIDDEYLYRNSREDAELYCCERLHVTESIGDVGDIIQIAKEYNLEAILVDAYKKIGDILFNNKDYLEAFSNYIKCLDRLKFIEYKSIEPDIYNKLGLCKLNQIQYLEAINYFNLAKQHAQFNNDNDIERRATYNLALCNKKLNKIDESLNYLDDVFLICNKEENFLLFVYATILKATCYEENGLFDDAIDLLKKLVENFKDPYHKNVALIYNNLGILYLKKDALDKSLHYFNWSCKIRENIDYDNLCHSLIEKSFIYIKQKNYNEAISLLNEGLNQAIKNNDNGYQLKAYYTLLEIYNELKMYNDVEGIYLEALKLLLDSESNLYKDDIIKIYVKLSCLYLEQSKYEELKQNLEKLQYFTCK